MCQHSRCMWLQQVNMSPPHPRLWQKSWRLEHGNCNPNLDSDSCRRKWSCLRLEIPKDMLCWKWSSCLWGRFAKDSTIAIVKLFFCFCVSFEADFNHSGCLALSLPPAWGSGFHSSAADVDGRGSSTRVACGENRHHGLLQEIIEPLGFCIMTTVSIMEVFWPNRLWFMFDFGSNCWQCPSLRCCKHLKDLERSILNGQSDSKYSTKYIRIFLPHVASWGFQEIARYRALALLPHVPYAQRLPDVFASWPQFWTRVSAYNSFWLPGAQWFL